MTSVIKKLALSAAAVVAVIGAVYVLPSAGARDPTQQGQVNQRHGVTTRIQSPAAFPSSLSSSDPVMVPGLGASSGHPSSATPAGPTGVTATRTAARPLATPPDSSALAPSPQPTARLGATPGSTRTSTSPEQPWTTASSPRTTAPGRNSATVPSNTPPNSTAVPKPAAPDTTAAPPSSAPNSNPTNSKTTYTKTTNASTAAPAPRPSSATRTIPRPAPKPVPEPAPKPMPAPAPAPAPANNFGIAVSVGNATQIITVRASSQYSTTGTLIAWQKQSNGGWTKRFGPVTAHLGSDGVGTPSEYNSHTPRGTFTISQAFGRQSDPGTSLPYTQVNGDDWWVSDVNSPAYNTLQVCALQNCPFDTAAGENLYDAGSVYNYALVMDVNRWPATRGGGSAYFLHVTDGTATAGCVSMDAGTLVSIMQWLTPAGHPRIAVNIG